MTREESNKFKWLSFAMTLAIVLFHANRGSPDSYSSILDEKIYDTARNISDILRRLAMGYFFMTTGFFMYKDIMITRGVKTRVVKRMYTLLVPFYVWDVIYFLFYIVRGYNIGNKAIIEEIVKRAIFEPFDGPLWYLMSIFMLCMAAPLIVRILKCKRICISLYLIICSYSFIVTAISQKFFILHGIGYDWYFARILEYMPNYFFGVLYAFYFPKFKIENNKIVKMLGGLFIVLLVSRIVVESSDNSAVKYILDRILPVLMFFAVSCNNKFFEKRCPDIFHAEFLIYAGQEVILTCIHYVIAENLWAYLHGWSLLLIRVVSIFIVIAFCYLLWKLLDKYFPKTLNLLTGGR